VNAEPDYQSLATLIEHRARTSASDVYLEDARSARTITYSGLAHAVSTWRALFESMALPLGAPVVVAVKEPLGFRRRVPRSYRKRQTFDTDQPRVAGRRAGAQL
jgi:hypothetical protein